MWCWEQWSRSAIIGNLLLLELEELLVACPPGHVGCFGLTEGAGPVAAATLGGDVGTTVLSEGCGLVLLMIGECGVQGWWRLWVLCVPWVGSVGHTWTPNTPQTRQPLSPVSFVGRGLVFEVLALGSPVV